ncbi:Cobalt-zinc-cadmium resistance protein CzcA; Cation efflux system protein CusA [Olavius algarvensis associated proteobacterium Delta 3]|nr:Cobalt-zinc-cadmium resistance protein CzcA; Cation efflux system protein CusA [Olavius algarvensis associated proteobacterium Delta 3]CAB5102256.1 Cobalt-zinc-cadmium resistance protein CzcA; Cation efflux system protein CusA [Olavius algarvensis associated proteobacterium Delta 3]
MKRIGAMAMLMVLMAAAGCQTGTQKKVYYVLFEKTPNIFDTQVYTGGELIGDIMSQEVGANNVYRVTVSIRADHVEKIRDNLVAVVKNGHLEFYPIGVVGNPLPYESRILGFRSKVGLMGFRFSHNSALLPQAAAETANRLYEASL